MTTKPAARSVLATAKADFAARRFAASEQGCRRVLAADPDNADALVLLAGLALRAGRADAAIPLLEKAIRLDPAALPAQAQLGGALLLAGREGDAIATFRAILERKPSHHQANVNVGLYELKSGNAEAAKRHFDRALKSAPDDVDTLIARGVAEAQLANHARAIADFRRALRLAPDHPKALGNLATALIEADQPDAALDALNRLPEPRSARWHFHAGLAHGAAERFDAAIAAYRQAISLEPHNTPALNNLGHMLRVCGNPEEAIGSFRAAFTLRPRDVELLQNLISTLVEVRRFDEAISTLQALCRQSPDNEKIILTAAHIFNVLGRFDLTRQLGGNLLDRDPDSTLGRALRGMGDDRRNDDADLAELRARADSADLEPVQRAGACFSLAKALDDRDDHAAAFRYLIEGNALVRRGIDYDAERTSAITTAVIQAFTPATFDRFRGFGSASTRPIFIIGTPRSGTTLTEQILVSHPDVIDGGELPTFPEAITRIDHQGDAAKRFPMWLPEMDGERAGALIERYLGKLNEISATAAHVTDKQVANIRYVGILAMLFPNARFIHCQRDPRDTAVSIFFQRFFENIAFAFDLYEIGRYYRDYQRIMAHWDAVVPVPIHSMVYEETVADLEGAARRLLDFCGLPWDDRVLRFHETERAVYTASQWQVRQPLYSSSVGRWQAYAPWLGPFEAGLAGQPRPKS